MRRGDRGAGSSQPHRHSRVSGNPVLPLAHDKERPYSYAMSMMVTELYDALIAAGAPEEKARAAAQAMSEESLATKADIARLERELSVVKWMTGAVFAGVVSLLLKSFAG